MLGKYHVVLASKELEGSPGARHGQWKNLTLVPPL